MVRQRRDIHSHRPVVVVRHNRDVVFLDSVVCTDAQHLHGTLILHKRPHRRSRGPPRRRTKGGECRLGQLQVALRFVEPGLRCGGTSDVGGDPVQLG